MTGRIIVAAVTTMMIASSAHGSNWMEIRHGANGRTAMMIDAESIGHSGYSTSASFRGLRSSVEVRHVGDCVARTMSGPLARTPGSADRPALLPVSSGSLDGDMLHAMCRPSRSVPARH